MNQLSALRKLSTTKYRSLPRLAVEWMLRRPIATAFLVAIFVRIIVTLLVTNILGEELVPPDALGYHDMAEAKASGDTSGWDEFTSGLYWRAGTFLIPLTLFYRVVGPSFLAGSIIVGFVGAGVAALTAFLAGRAGGRIAALAAGIFIALLPSQVFWSSMTLKDPLVWLLLAGLAITITIASNMSGPRLLLTFLCAGLIIYGIAYLRPNTLVVASWATGLSCWVGIARHRWWRAGGGLVLAVSVPLIVGWGPAGWTLVSNTSPQNVRILNALDAESAVIKVPSFDKLSLDPLQQHALGEKQLLKEQADLLEQHIAQLKREGREADRPTEAPRAQSIERAKERLENVKKEIAVLEEPEIEDRVVAGGDTQFRLNLRYLPHGLTVMLFEPYPWEGGESTSTGLKLAQAETLVWYPILVLALIGLWKARRRLNVTLFPILAGGATLVTYALTEGNLGTAYRHRGEFVWAVGLLAGLGFQTLIQYFRARRKRSAAAVS